jgi:transposase
MKPIPLQTVSLIVKLSEEGCSTRQIASRLNIGRDTVSRYLKTKVPNAVKSKGGRPSKLSLYQKRLIVRKVVTGEVSTAAAMHRDLSTTSGTNVSYQLVKNMLHEAGLRTVSKVKKPLLLPRHIKARLDFALKYKDWTIDDWKRVIWSDESKINRFGSDGRKRCWKLPGASLKSHHIQPTIKHGGGSLMVWGCMTAEGVGNLCRIDGGLNADLYCCILEEDLKATIDYYRLDVDQVIFQHDNDPKHTAKKTCEWLRNNGINILDWPPQSPDLNPIEHLWDHLKRRLNAYEKVATSMHELWLRVEAEWNAIDKQECVKLIESMPRRVFAVLKAKGRYTKY